MDAESSQIIPHEEADQTETRGELKRARLPTEIPFSAGVAFHFEDTGGRSKAKNPDPVLKTEV